MNSTISIRESKEAEKVLKSPRVLAINSVNYGSTGTIMLGILNTAADSGFHIYPSYPSSRSNHKKKVDNEILISNRIERNLHLKLAYYTGNNGCFSRYGTKVYLKKIDQIKPDIIHLHNLHNCYINLKMLFEYIKIKNIPVVWTLHDCWAFTGQCPHYTMIQCDRWVTGCHDCPQYRQYPAARIDRTKEMYQLKKSWFTEVKNLTIVTPSEWLKNEVKNSFLKDYSVEVINNGIDLSVFKPTETGFRQKYNLTDKIVLLGVANPWSERKGLNVFVELAKLIHDMYKIVLVGLSEKQIKELPKNILGLPKTSNPTELAGIYSSADYFINPSLEETMGLVTVESIACGTPAIVSNSTAVPEMVNESCGLIVTNNTSIEYYNAIMRLSKKYKIQDCLNHANKFRKKKKFNEYLGLFNEIIRTNSREIL